jgi:hypothetical protein
MASFSDCDTDYSGASRFQDIMNNGGNIDIERLQDFISTSANDLADGGKDTIRHLEFGNGLSVVCAWEEAPAAEDDGHFVGGGYEICVSVRETESAPRVEEWANISGSVALTESDEADNYKEVAEGLYAQVMDADPETVDSGLQDREETVFDSLPDFKGAFEKWQDAVNSDMDTDLNDTPLHIQDMELGKHESSNGEIGDAVFFRVEESIVDADMATIDEYLTGLMPQEIVDWLDQNNLNFNYDMKDEHTIAFLVW